MIGFIYRERNVYGRLCVCVYKYRRREFKSLDVDEQAHE